MGTLGALWLGGVLSIAAQWVDVPGGAAFQTGDGPGGGRRPASTSACLDCHQLPDRLTHPIGVRVDRPVQLPLGEGRTLTCVTCHDPGQHKFGGVVGMALRMRAPDLCRECHAETTEMTRAEHGIALGRAHFLGSRSRLSAHGVDSITRECTGCHDSSVAAEKGGGMPIGGRASHPVGRTYDEYSRSGQKGHLRPRQSLPDTVQLAGQTVGCGSCHSPFSREVDMLTATMVESRLCLTCHDM